MQNRAKVSYWIRNAKDPLISSDDLQRLVSSLPVITVQEQADNFIRLLGDRFDSARSPVLIDSYQHLSLIGAPTPQDLSFLVNGIYKIEQITTFGSYVNPSGESIEKIFARYEVQPSLTLAGWARYEELVRTKSDSDIGFMAMPFSSKDIVNLYKETYKNAASVAGFRLHSLLDDHRPGLIDEKLKVEIRRAAFIVADVTDPNPNVLWEAGFAEGLNKPVIYSCREDKWNSVKEKTFDTNHLYTIIWKPDELQDAGDRLTATIRDTFPNRAK